MLIGLYLPISLGVTADSRAAEKLARRVLCLPAQAVRCERARGACSTRPGRRLKYKPSKIVFRLQQRVQRGQAASPGCESIPARCLFA